MKLRFLVLAMVLCLGINKRTVAEDVKNDTMIKIQTTAEELPHEILDLDDEASRARVGTPYEVVMIFVNDVNGDDLGFTHGARIEGATKTKNGIRLKLAYSTDLYTAKAAKKNAEGLTPQYFTDENLVRFIADNMYEGKLWYWKGEVGWHQLNNIESDNLFYGSAQQMMIHTAFKEYKSFRHAIPTEEGRGRQNGIMGDVAVGFQRDAEFKGAQLRAKTQIGTRQSSLDNASYDYASFDLSSSYIIRDKVKFSVMAETKAIRHQTGTEFNHSLNTSVKTKRWELGAGVMQVDGEVNNYVAHNKPSIKTNEFDPIYKVYMTYRFGRKVTEISK